ncbi:thioredoxin TrxC [Vibrio metschnikovii]|uniref:Thioredoxin n=1 Tax=bacterium 19MO02SH05 TaxID=2920696 RepID=A0AAU6TME6_UNCXX|nr:MULTISPECIES: thioredoxin TrxC [Vibrio]EKO3579334.1 thioredoxin TrxC [Vibrio metschnikovii]EKO3582836.1 thioredoxin TrxC [Vibrio metschnikovii]EKO3587801.1 thioredoxin TrxC [Vibrio metschnikovii]EKO3630637.1 thioredoxin TrxC [Vibrio metschnikovii]EKO3642053.1 thioredoxin TrxC [Vibrio metschnikovii]
MSTFTTRCPACHGLNRIPTARVSESPRCGKCQAALLDGAPIEGTADNLEALLASEQPVVIDFWAPWCNPCVGFAPIFHDVAVERQGQVRFIKIDTEAQQALAGKYQIRSIPTLMVFKQGKRVDVLNGALPKSQFEQWLNQALTK